MSRRLDGKDEDELALDDKLDLARTMLALESRQKLRRSKNAIETVIRQSHREEVNAGEVTQPVIPSADEILALFGTKAITAGTEEAPATKRRFSR